MSISDMRERELKKQKKVGEPAGFGKYRSRTLIVVVKEGNGSQQQCYYSFVLHFYTPNIYKFGME